MRTANKIYFINTFKTLYVSIYGKELEMSFMIISITCFILYQNFSESRDGTGLESVHPDKAS